MSKQYKYNKIPKKFDEIIYTNYCYHSDYTWRIGCIEHSTSDLSGDNYICIAQTPVSIFVPEQKTDIKKLVIAALEEEKKKQAAEYHKRMLELQQKIESLLCLEYKPSGDSPPSAVHVDDVPF